MEQVPNRMTRPRTRTFVLVLLAGLAVLLLLFPGSGIDRQPPECYSMFGYTVPCGGQLALVAAAMAAGVVGFALWLYDRRPSRRGR
jgi:hypothetical protein